MYASHVGRLDFATLWSQWFVERLLFPRLLVLVLARTTHLDLIVEMYLSAALLFASVALFIVAHRRRAPLTPLTYYVPIAVVMLCVTQYENTLWGFQIAWYMILLAFALAVFLLDRPGLSWPGLAMAALAAVVGSFSSFQGLIIWPAGLVLLYLRRRPASLAATWAGAAAVTASLYFVGLKRPPNTTFGLEHPVAGIKFFFFAIGDVLGVQVPYVAKAINPWVEAFGIVIFACAVWVIVTYGFRRPGGGPQAVGLAMVSFGLLWAVSLSLSQSSSGLSEASFSRFTLYNLLIPAGCYLAVLGTGHEYRGVVAVRTVVAGVVCVLAVVGTANGVTGGRVTYLARVQEAIVTMHAREATDAQLSSVDPLIGPGFIPSGLPRATELHLSMFDSPTAMARFSRVGMGTGMWSSSLTQPVNPWRNLENGQEVVVDSAGFPPGERLVLRECSRSIVDTLDPESLTRTGLSSVPFSSRYAWVFCHDPMRVDASADGRLTAKYRVFGGRGTVHYLAVEALARRGVLAAKELVFR